jgi:hypothetical protein
MRLHFLLDRIAQGFVYRLMKAKFPSLTVGVSTLTRRRDLLGVHFRQQQVQAHSFPPCLFSFPLLYHFYQLPNSHVTDHLLHFSNIRAMLWALVVVNTADGAEVAH